MGFGYKTSWIAVHGRTSEEVADALGLIDRRPMAYAEGTSAAYEAGIYVTPTVQGWILAHGTDLASTIDETSDRMLDWLSGLSQSLGTVQFFGTHRVSEWHQWVWAEDGSIIRAFAYADGQARMSVGEVTEAERAAGVVLQDDEPGMSSWSEEQWEASYDSHPDEQHVMQIAGMWSVDPTSIDDDDIASAGIYGIPASQFDNSAKPSAGKARRWTCLPCQRIAGQRPNGGLSTQVAPAHPEGGRRGYPLNLRFKPRSPAFALSHKGMWHHSNTAAAVRQVVRHHVDRRIVEAAMCDTALSTRKRVVTHHDARCRRDDGRGHQPYEPACHVDSLPRKPRTRIVGRHLCDLARALPLIRRVPTYNVQLHDLFWAWFGEPLLDKAISARHDNRQTGWT